MIVTELKAEVEKAIGQGIDDGGRFTGARVVTALNDAYIEFAAQTGCFERTATMAAVSGTADYALPADFETPLWCKYDGTTLTPNTEAVLDIENPAWRDASAGTPQEWLRSGALEFTLSPAPSGTANITIRGTIVPSAVNGGKALLVDTNPYTGPLIPMRYHMALAHYATWRLASTLFPDDPGAMAAGVFGKAEFERLVKEMRASLVTEGAYR